MSEVTLSDDAVPAGASRAPVVAYRQGRSTEATDWLVEEAPIAFVFNGLSHAVMLGSPTDLEDFALGFCLSEGLLESRLELYGIEIVEGAQGIELQLEVAAAAEYRLKARRRHLEGRTGCGLCGAESLEQVVRPLPALDAALAIVPAAISRALRALTDAQPLNRRTGAVHAAAWCDANGNIVSLREDVGRHNALDKLIGALVRAEVDVTRGFVLITSRASLEMVQKAAMAGISMLVAVSAPTALAVRVARQAGLALAGFARGPDVVAYSHAERFGLNALQPVARQGNGS